MNEPMKLYRVTLDWQQNDPEQGDYCVNVWASDDDNAIRLVAEEMAAHEDSGCETDDERAAFVAARIAEAGPYGAEEVARSILYTVRMLMAGPAANMSATAERDYERIAALLDNYGATR